MARINIEEKFWFDPRLEALSKKIGSNALAVGYVLKFWRLAQEQFKNGKLVTESQFKLAELPDALFDCEFAIKTTHGIRCKGDKRNFGWLLERKEAGRQGGLAKAKTRSSEINDLTLANASKAQQTLPSTSFSTSNSKKETKERKTKEAPQVGTSQFVAAYVRAYQTKFGRLARPAFSGKALGVIKRLVTDLGADRACELVQAYLQMDDPWFLTKAYDIVTFSENVQKISLALDTGRKDPTKKKTGLEEWMDEHQKSMEPT